MPNLTDPLYTDENKAREHFEKLLWPDGPICPRCGSVDRSTKLKGKSTRPGVYKCKDCRKPFSVTVGTLMERSHIKINVWLAAMHLMTASKKGMSAHQMGRMLGLSYESAWFLCHRLREAMHIPLPGGGLGGQGKTVEADETHVGGKAKNRAYAKKPPRKEIVMSLVERDGEVRSYHIANVTAKSLREVVVKVASRKSYLMTDELTSYASIGKEFSGHGTVNHSADEYVRGVFWHTNTVENYFSILKRGIYGVYQHVSEAHLKRYLVEFDFRYSNRKITDTERAEKALRGMVGKRLTYRRPDNAGYDQAESPIPF